MNFQINDNEITITKTSGVNFQTWVMTKYMFKNAYRGFEPLPQNVLEWMNS
jgi:hypothetical protein